MTALLKVEIWSDVICPWCWIGKRRFERALEAFPQRDQVQVIHRAFRLMPGVAAQALAPMMAQRFGSADKAQAMLEQVEQTAAAEGLSYHLAGCDAGDTLDAHRLLQFAGTQQKQGALIERFYRGYFSEHVSLFDHEALLHLATEAGLERDAAQAVLQGSSYAAEVEADQVRIRALGATGVPFLLLNEQVSVSGAQAPQIFLDVLTQAWQFGQPGHDALSRESTGS